MAIKERKTKKSKATAKAGQAAKTVKVTRIVPKKEKKDKEESKVILRIRVRAYESKILDSSVKQIMDTAIRYDAIIVGPVPLPTEIKKYTVNRSPFIYKNTREQFEIRVHKRLIDIINPNSKTVEALTNLSLPSGVDIDVKML
ncbi:MAG: small subunit ribosomal protein S10 [Parcubacteria group bacterium Gr01-1014_24]|nr:MAG: small subunit ribosomal protein S10 [Parcubacteria group bacterium Gr01-1014_24]